MKQLLNWENKRKGWYYTDPTISGHSEERFSKRWKRNLILPALTEGRETETINKQFASNIMPVPEPDCIREQSVHIIDSIKKVSSVHCSRQRR